MKLKGIKKLLYGLVPAVLALFSVSIIASAKKTVEADATTVPYSFATGLNAFEDGGELTITAPVGDWTQINYMPNTYTEETPAFQGITENGYIALQVETDKTIAMYMALWDGGETPAGYVPAGWLVDEYGNAVSVTNIGLGHYIPAGFRGMFVMAVSGFEGANLGNVLAVTANFHAQYAGAKVKLGSLGYYASNVATEMHMMTTADTDVWNDVGCWKMNSSIPGVFKHIAEKSAEAPVYTMRTGENKFAYGKTWNVAGATGVSKAWYKSDTGGTYELDITGYLALQVETITSTGIYMSISAGEVTVPYAGSAYFVSEDKSVEVCAYNIRTNHIEIPAGKCGMVVFPLKNFVLPTDGSFDWQTTMYTVTINTAYYPNANLKIGELGWFDSVNTEMYMVTSLRDMYDAGWKVSDNEVGTLERIEYIPEVPAEYSMRKGDNAFAYGVSWTDVDKTTEAAWSKLAVKFDKSFDLNLGSGIIAVQMEIIRNGGSLKFLPSLWDGAETESSFAGTATFVTEEGNSFSYNVSNGILDIPPIKGVLLLSVPHFDEDIQYLDAQYLVLTVDTRVAFDYTLNIGEIGYFEDADAAMEKMVALDSVKDYNQFENFDTIGGENKGTLKRIVNKEITPTARFVSASAAGDIGLIFYVEFPNEANDVVTATVAVEGGKSSTVTGIYNNAKGCFAFIVGIAPKDYQKNVTLSVAGNVVYTTTVAKYANSLIHADGTEENEKNLAVALLNYCEAAKAYFDGETVEKVDFDVDLSAYVGSKVDNTGDVTIEDATLSLGAKTTINVYFTTSADISTINVTGATVSHVEGNTYVASVENIVAKHLDYAYQVQIGEDIVTYSALSYVYEIVSNAETPAALYNLVVALYNYNVAANTYFGA